MTPDLRTLKSEAAAFSAQLETEIAKSEQAVNAHLRPDPFQKTQTFLQYRQLTASEPYPHFTDVGNAQWLVGREGEDLRFCYAWGRWLVWDGRRWAEDSTGAVERRAKETIRSMYGLAMAEPDANIRKALADHARRSEADGKIQPMIRLAQSEPGIHVKPDQLDADPWALNCLNGTVDLKTGLRREHRRKDLITKLIPVDYDLTAEAPIWMEFLNRITDGNRALTDFLQRAVGYSLTGDTAEQCLFLLHGTGANGKSTFLNVLQALIGDYALQAAFETFLLRDRGGIPNDLARLNKARFVAAIEAEAGRRLAESTVKQLTGGDRITARFLHAEFFEFVPQFKLWLACNHKPTIRGTDLAIWRRIRLIPFSVQIPEAERDPKMADRLKAELPGVLAWAVKGCLAWRDFGLRAPEAVKAATQAYREDMDTLGQFIDECCTVEPEAVVSTGELYEGYKNWADEKKPISKQVFGMILAERGFVSDRKAKGVRFWNGIGLKPLTG